MARPQRFRRHRFSLLRFVLKTLEVLGGLSAGGLRRLPHRGLHRLPAQPHPHADGIVALTGGDDRIGTALALLAAHDAPLLLISGAGHGTYLGDFTANDPPPPPATPAPSRSATWPAPPTATRWKPPTGPGPQHAHSSS